MRSLLSGRSLAGLFALSILVTIGGVFMWPPSAPAAPTIAWTPDSLHIEIARGETRVLRVAFSASEIARDISIRIVPELEPFVRANRTSIAELKEHEPNTIDLTVSTSSTSPLGTVSGTIQLRSGRTLSRPLPVTISIGTRNPPLSFRAVARPALIDVGVASNILFEVELKDDAIVNSSLTLERLDPSGNVETIGGDFNDSGVEGDSLARDRIYSRRVMLTEHQLGAIYFRVSATAVDGTPLSQQVFVTVTDVEDAEEFLNSVERRLRRQEPTALDSFDIAPRVKEALQAAGGPAFEALADMIAQRSIGRTTSQYREYRGPYPTGPGTIGQTTFVVARRPGQNWKIISF